MEFVPIDKKIIAKNLKALRKVGFKSREAFCEVLGMPVSRYAEYEQGRVSLPYEVAWLIADILECPMDDIGGREWVGRLENVAIPDSAAQGSEPQINEGNDGREKREIDDGTLMLAERIARLPGGKRKAIQDFLSFQESQTEKTGGIPSDMDQAGSQAVAS